MKAIMGRSGLGAATPIPVPGLASTKVLVMTRLFGYKVILIIECVGGCIGVRLASFSYALCTT